MKRMRGKKIFVRREATRRPAPYELIERIRRHFVGRVMTLAAATACPPSALLGQTGWIE